MKKNNSLEENVQHGTRKRPLTIMHFQTGIGTPYPDHFLVERHWHYNIEILKIIKGRYKAEINLETVHLKEGDICMINSGELHMLEGEVQDTCHDALIFNPQIMSFSYEDEMQEELIFPVLQHQVILPRVITSQEEDYNAINTCFDICITLGEGKEDFWYAQIKIELLKLLVLLERNKRLTIASDTIKASEKERIDRYKRVVSQIETQFDKELTLEMLAKTAGCNSQYFCRLFKEIAGISPIQYLIRYRVIQAQRLLDVTTKTVLEISMECGFENVSYFIRQFKKITGYTPREYRNSDKTSRY